MAVNQIKETMQSFRDSIIALRVTNHCLPSEMTAVLEDADSNILQTIRKAKELLGSFGIDFGEDNWI